MSDEDVFQLVVDRLHAARHSADQRLGGQRTRRSLMLKRKKEEEEKKNRNKCSIYENEVLALDKTATVL